MIKGIKVFLYQLRKGFFTWRIFVIYVCIGIFIYSYLQPIAKMVEDVKIKATPMAFVHLMNDYICQTIIVIGFIFMMSNAPFKGKSSHYIIYRCGVKTWEVGNFIYITVNSFLYTGFLVLISIISLFGKLDFNLENWGKIWGTLARTNASAIYGLKFSINDYLLGKYEPAAAFTMTFFLSILCFLWIGLLIYLLNKFIFHGAGILGAGFFVFLDTMIYNMWTPWAYRFSPLTLMQLIAYTNYNKYYGLSLTYAWLFFAGCIILFVAIMLLAPEGGDIQNE